MNVLKVIVSFAGLWSCCCAPTATAATLITAGDQLRIDFDIATTLPGPFVELRFGLAFGIPGVPGNTQAAANVFVPGDSYKIAWFDNDGTALSALQSEDIRTVNQPVISSLRRNDLDVPLTDTDGFGILTMLTGSFVVNNARVGLLPVAFGPNSTGIQPATFRKVNPVPVPASVVLMGSAIGVFGAFRRRFAR
ncbi:MAG: VPLPA-CTERM sorting domain-containing protein [Pseudomonadota bacterium]